LEEHPSWDFERFGFEQTQRILRNGGFPTRTVLCANDRVAFGVIAAAYQAGLRIGHEPGCDLRVAGHDDHPLSRYACPPITTVAQNYNDIGRFAMELLLHRLGEIEEPYSQEMSNGQILLNAELQLRQSA
jgi:DNA-binding LacI/PurR family transcriptional regulator